MGNVAGKDNESVHGYAVANLNSQVVKNYLGRFVRGLYVMVFNN